MKTEKFFPERAVSWLLLLGFLFCLGCATLPRQVNDLLSGQQASFSRPLNTVIQSACFSLHDLGFCLNRIEMFRQEGLIQASWQQNRFTVKLQSLSPGLTRMSCMALKANQARAFSSETEFFNHVRQQLAENHQAGFQEILEDMVRIRNSPTTKAPVIGYLGPGVRVQARDAKAPWTTIFLNLGGKGYVQTHHLVQESSLQDVSELR